MSAYKTYFDDLIDRHAEAYLSAFPEIREFNEFEQKSGTSNYYIGMLYTNNFEQPRTIRIRGSKSIADNRLVELDLTNLLDRLIETGAQESFFPGQIIAFKAEPFGSKRQLTVTKILDSTKIAPSMKKYHLHDKVVLATANGPFVKSDQDDWTLYDRIISNIKEHDVTHFILIGPIADTSTGCDTYWSMAMDRLIEGLHDHECQIYVVPTNKDILPSSFGSTYSYPCSELRIKIATKEGANIMCKINFVTDPAQIDIDGLVIEVTSADVVFQMSRCISLVNRVENLLTTIFRSLITYGIYPIYPSHQDLPVDPLALRKFNQLDRLGPHIMIVPNQLGTSSVHEVEDRIVVATKKCSLGKQMILVEILPTTGDGVQKPNWKIINLINE